MNREFIRAIEELEKEKGVSKDILIESIELALVSAYKKNYGTSQNVRVNIDREGGDIDVFMRKDVVEEVTDDLIEVSLEEAQELDPRYMVGDGIEYQVTPRDFGRIAAQTAKQVVVQRIREAERDLIYDDYISKQGEVVTGVIQRIGYDSVFINIGKAEGRLVASEQVPGEVYTVNKRIKVYVMDVKNAPKGPQIYLSRSHPGIVKKLFELEVPEIQDGTVVIKNVAREAGFRTKMAVYTADPNIDPVGACVGSRGARVRNVVEELFGEKIDIITWSEDSSEFITKALSPAKPDRVMVNEDGKAAVVVVPDSQLSLAIGKEGQNVRLAAKLCGYKIDIKSDSQFDESDFDEFDDIEYVDDEFEGEISEFEEAEAETEIVEVEAVEPEEVAEVAPKKRGRKPKVEAVAKTEIVEVEAVEPEEVAEEAPKKRGRKPKAEAEAETEIVEVEAESAD